MFYFASTSATDFSLTRSTKGLSGLFHRIQSESLPLGFRENRTITFFFYFNCYLIHANRYAKTRNKIKYNISYRIGFEHGYLL